jgi:hypothetical protein
VVALALPPTFAYAPPVPVTLDAFACSACASANEPLTRCPVALVLGSATESRASPAVVITLAVVPASYMFATPGVNVPNDTGAPSDRLSVAGTVPPTSRPIWNVCERTADTLPLMSTPIHFTVVAPAFEIVSTWPGRRGPWFS